jgi:transglutaminase-like putative cysteine protease
MVQRVVEAQRIADHQQRCADLDLLKSTLIYLLSSRFCETDLLSDIAWQRFASVPAGRARVQAICDFVHQRIEFGYLHARSTRTAMEAYTEGRGVCRTTPTWRLPCAGA